MSSVGVDPGNTGAIALLSGADIDIWDMPVMKTKDGKNTLDLYRLAAMIRLINKISLQGDVYIEKVHSMPSQGVSSTFKFGYSYGAVCGQVTSTFGRFIDVTPQKWKKHFNLIGEDKDASRLLALELFPKAANKLKRKKDHGRADALLIAKYGLDQ